MWLTSLESLASCVSLSITGCGPDNLQQHHSGSGNTWTHRPMLNCWAHALNLDGWESGGMSQQQLGETLLHKRKARRVGKPISVFFFFLWYLIRGTHLAVCSDFTPDSGFTSGIMWSTMGSNLDLCTRQMAYLLYYSFCPRRTYFLFQ